METLGNKVIRQTKEREITKFYEAGDAVQVNHELDRYPHGQYRADLELSAAKAIAQQCMPLKQVVALNDWRRAA